MIEGVGPGVDGADADTAQIVGTRIVGAASKGYGLGGSAVSVLAFEDGRGLRISPAYDEIAQAPYFTAAIVTGAGAGQRERVAHAV